MTEARLIERDAELTELRAAVEDAGRGAGRLVVIEGIAGIGKTALVRAAQDAGGEAGMRVLRARGTELERDFPFALVRQLFEPPLARAGPARRDELLDGAARLAGPIVGAEPAGREVPGATTDATFDPSFATLNALFWLTSNLAEDAPTLLAVDDAHWADEASLRYLTFLLPRLEELPVLLVVAARPSEPGTEGVLVDQLAADPAAQVLRPEALSAEAVAEMVHAAFASGGDERFCAACREATGGNPFMLSELLVELRSEAGNGDAPPVEQVREIAPAAIRRSVLIRLGRLPDEAQRLARTIAVLGDDADAGVAAALAEVDDAAAAKAIDALAGAGVLAAQRPLRFRHPLLRTAVYADLPPAERSAAHARAAKLLAARGMEPDRVALHLLATEPAGDEATVRALAAAADRALDRAAPEAALRYLERALAEPATPSTRPTLIRLLLTAAIRGGAGREDVNRLVGPDPVAELSADEDTFLASAWQIAMALLSAGESDEVARTLGRAATIAAERGDVALALRLESLVAATSMLAPADAQARFARHAGAIEPDTAAERLWLAMQSWWGAFLGRSAEESAELARRALADGRIFDEQPDLPPPGQAILVLARAERLDLAADRLEAAAAEAARRGSVTGLGQASYLRGYVAYLRGDVAGAEPDARSAVEAARRGGYLQAVPVFPALLLDVLVERDEPEAAEEELVQGGWSATLPDNYWWAGLLLARARLRLAQQRLDEAIADLTALEQANERHGILSPFYSVRSYLAFALVAQGRREEAHAAAAADLERARAWGARSTVATSLRALARAAESRDEELELLAEAVDVLEGSPHRLEYARALADAGAALRRAGRRAEARERLRGALELARRGGALAIARRAHDELEATGEKLRPLMAAGVEALTPSERRVAELAARGLTNREVAQSLFLTVKTVETHLSHAYRKLDIRSRTELPAAMAAE